MDVHRPGAAAVSLYLRLALGLGFLSAVADRLGLWGPPGAPGVAWGEFSSFLEYTAVLNPWAPEALIPALGWFVTGAEIALGLALVVGLYTRTSAALSGILLALFAGGMIVGSGLKSPFDASVFSASAAAFALALLGPGALNVDRARKAAGNRSGA